MDHESFDTILKHFGIKGIHPATELLPMATEEELAIICADIEANGFIHPIRVNKAGLLLDGRNRLRAAWVLKKDNVPIERVNPQDVFAYVFSENIARRHLTVGQRAMLGMKLANLPHGGRIYKMNEVANTTSIRREEAAKLLNIHKGNFSIARFIQQWAPPEAEQVTNGTLELDAAYQTARHNK